MALGQRGDVLRGFRTLFESGSIAGLTDAELLERSSSREGASAELAFSALVERHGPMVLRVCRKALGDPHDAHDAFQSTFLVLARKGDSIRDKRSVGSWLHGVALRVSATSRATEARRRKYERRKVERMPRADGFESPDDLGAVLHEEVGRLPGRYRDAVVLCYLEGRSCEEAAGHLRIPVGTIKSRLSWARERLRDRLTSRGLAPAAGAVATMLAAESAHASMPIPSSWVESTASSAITFAKVGSGMVPGPASALAKGVIHAMMMSKIKVATAAIAGLVLTGAALMAQQTARTEGGDSDRDRLKAMESKLDRLINVLEKQTDARETPAVDRLNSRPARPAPPREPVARRAPAVDEVFDGPAVTRFNRTAPPVNNLRVTRAENAVSIEERLARLEARMDRLEQSLHATPTGTSRIYRTPPPAEAPSANVPPQLLQPSIPGAPSVPAHPVPLSPAEPFAPASASPAPVAPVAPAAPASAPAPSVLPAPAPSALPAPAAPAEPATLPAPPAPPRVPDRSEATDEATSEIATLPSPAGL